MIKRFIKDNRGQVLYAVLVTIMFVGMLSMITMGLTLKNYNATLNKQQHVTDYYAADAVAELIRIEKLKIGDNPVTVNAETFEIVDVQGKNPVPQNVVEVTNAGGGKYIIKTATATLETTIVEKKFTSWEVSYHAAEQPAK